eukprot:748669-Hanusia_phi.AAC.2
MVCWYPKIVQSCRGKIVFRTKFLVQKGDECDGRDSAKSDGWRHGEKTPASVEFFLRKRDVMWKKPFLLPSRGEEEARRVFTKSRYAEKKHLAVYLSFSSLSYSPYHPPFAIVRQGWNFGQTPLSEPGIGRSTMESIPVAVLKHFPPVVTCAMRCFAP